MDSAVASRLLELNREFYTRFGDSFSATRHRIQPGVRRVLGMLQGKEDILDLGCGNGELARALAKGGHRGSYLGVDLSLPMLREAESQPEGFSATFKEADLTQLALTLDQLEVANGWSLITRSISSAPRREATPAPTATTTSWSFRTVFRRAFVSSRAAGI